MSGLQDFNCELYEMEEVDESLLCPVCKELMNKACSMPCGHSACKECLVKMAQMQHQAVPKTCPVCRTSFAGQQLRTNVVVNGLISKIKVTCKNDNCSWTGEQGQKEEHYEKCPFLLVCCPNGCPSTHLRGRIRHHLANCPNQRVECKFCKGEIRRARLATHERDCTETPRPCPLGCGDNLPRSNVHLHLFQCPNKAIKCPVTGCNNFFKRGKQLVHDMNHAESHQAQLKAEVEKLRCAIFDKSNTITTRRMVSGVRSFRWRVKAVDCQGREKISSPMFGFDRKQFNILWSRNDSHLYLAKVSGSSAVTIKTRFIVIKKGKPVGVFSCDAVTIKEGEKVGRKVDIVTNGDNWELAIKVIVYLYMHI